MIRTTPFHPRLSELNTQGLYTHWQGHLSPLRYTHAPKHEYFAVRNTVGVFDTSPLFKYRITGPDAERLLAGVLVRDIRTCRPGPGAVHAVVRRPRLRHGGRRRLPAPADDFLLTAARPNLGWFGDHRGRLRVELEDVSDDYGILAVQGPRSRTVLARAGARGRLARLLRAHPGQGRPARRSRCRAPATPATSASRSPSRPTTRSTCSTRCSRPGRATASARSARRR